MLQKPFRLETTTLCGRLCFTLNACDIPWCSLLFWLFHHSIQGYSTWAHAPNKHLTVSSVSQSTDIFCFHHKMASSMQLCSTALELNILTLLTPSPPPQHTLPHTPARPSPMHPATTTQEVHAFLRTAEFDPNVISDNRDTEVLFNYSLGLDSLCCAHSFQLLIFRLFSYYLTDPATTKSFLSFAENGSKSDTCWSRFFANWSALQPQWKRVFIL